MTTIDVLQHPTLQPDVAPWETDPEKIVSSYARGLLKAATYDVCYCQDLSHICPTCRLRLYSGRDRSVEAFWLAIEVNYPDAGPFDRDGVWLGLCNRFIRGEI